MMEVSDELKKKIREKIKALTLSNSKHEIALWSLHVPKHEKKEFSETDFILIARQGICCIEVKGGRVSYINGVFLFTNRHGNISQKKEGPIQQMLAGSADVDDRRMFNRAEIICIAYESYQRAASLCNKWPLLQYSRFVQ